MNADGQHEQIRRLSRVRKAPLVGFPLALVMLLFGTLVTLLGLLAPPASASPLLHPETRVAAIANHGSQLVGPSATVAEVQGRERAPNYDHPATGSSVAAEGGTAAADIGHAGIHQFPDVLAGKSQFFDNVDLGQLSDTTGLDGTLQANGNTRFVLHAPEDIGVDRTTGLPTNIYTVIRGPDGNVITMFPGTSPKS